MATTYKSRIEMDEVTPDHDVIPDVSILNRCDYLNAFVKELLCLYGAAPSLLERVVPSPSSPSRPSHHSSPSRPSSRTSSPSRAASPILSTEKAHEEFDMMGYALPPGAVVSTQAWSMHRREEVFESGETFLPERWLVGEGEEEEEEGRLAEMHAHLVPFSVGTRVYGGQNLAQLMLRVVLAAVCRAYDVRADVRETDAQSMEMRDAFVLFPKAKACRLAFVPRGSA